MYTTSVGNTIAVYGMILFFPGMFWFSDLWIFAVSQDIFRVYYEVLSDLICASLTKTQKDGSITACYQKWRQCLENQNEFVLRFHTSYIFCGVESSIFKPLCEMILRIV